LKKGRGRSKGTKKVLESGRREVHTGKEIVLLLFQGAHGRFQLYQGRGKKKKLATRGKGGCRRIHEKKRRKAVKEKR